MIIINKKVLEQTRKYHQTVILYGCESKVCI